MRVIDELKESLTLIQAVRKTDFRAVLFRLPSEVIGWSTGARSAGTRYRKAVRSAHCARTNIREVCIMISAWWLIPAILGGAVFGIFLLAIVNAGRNGHE